MSIKTNDDQFTDSINVIYLLFISISLWFLSSFVIPKLPDETLVEAEVEEKIEQLLASGFISEGHT